MKRIALIVLLFLIFTSGLIMLLQGLSRAYLAEPIFRILVLGRVLLDMIPQPILWGLFLLGAATLAMRTLLAGRQTREEAQIEPATSLGRVSEMAYWLKQSSQGQYFRWQIAQHLSEMAVEALAHRQRTSVANIKNQLRAGKLNAPAQVREYLRAGAARVYSRPAASIDRLFARLRTQPNNTALALNPLEAIQYIEENLETPYDDEDL